MPVVKSGEACWPCLSVAAPRCCSSPLPSLSRFLTPGDGRRQLYNDLNPSERGLRVPSLLYTLSCLCLAAAAALVEVSWLKTWVCGVFDRAGFFLFFSFFVNLAEPSCCTSPAVRTWRRAGTRLGP